MTLSEKAYIIKNSIDVQAALERYGMAFDVRGFAKCPFHVDKTASFKVKSNSCHCFGCNWSGDLIDVTAKIFNIGFSDTLSKLNEDFGIGLNDLGRVPAIKKEFSEHYIKHLEAEEAKKLKSEAYNMLSGEWNRLDINEKKYAPVSMEDPLDDRFCEAIVRKPIIDYLIMTLI